MQAGRRSILPALLFISLNNIPLNLTPKRFGRSARKVCVLESSGAKVFCRCLCKKCGHLDISGDRRHPCGMSPYPDTIDNRVTLHMYILRLTEINYHIG